MMAGIALVIGIVGLSDAWLWAGMNGPVHRLTTRAFGIGLGSVIPAVVAGHALYFKWANSAEAAFVQGMINLVDLAWRRRWLG